MEGTITGRVRRKRTVSLGDDVWKRLGRLAVDLDTNRSELIGRWTVDELNRIDRQHDRRSDAHGEPT